MHGDHLRRPLHQPCPRRDRGPSRRRRASPRPLQVWHQGGRPTRRQDRGGRRPPPRGRRRARVPPHLRMREPTTQVRDAHARDIGPRGGRRQDHGRRGRRGDGPGLARRRRAGGPVRPRPRASARRRTPTIPRTSTSTKRCRANTRGGLSRERRPRARGGGFASRGERGGRARRRLGGAEAGTAPPPQAAPTRVEDVSAREGRATVVFEPLPSRAGTGTRARDDATTATTTTRNFKKFRKTTRGPAKSLAGADTSSARRARRPAVAYADEAYDALHQWEDATVAAAHAAARADAQTAEEMFETGNRVRAPRGVHRRRANLAAPRGQGTMRMVRDAPKAERADGNV